MRRVSDLETEQAGALNKVLQIMYESLSKGFKVFLQLKSIYLCFFKLFDAIQELPELFHYYLYLV